MTKGTEIVVIEEHPKPKEQGPKINLFSLFPNFKFDLQLPFFNPKPKDKPLVADVAVTDQKKPEQEASKPNVVWFPKTQVAVPPPLETQAEAQGSTKTSNPVILWQVYALGAFFISRWVWARWNERKAQGRSPNDGDGAEGRHSDDVPRSSDNE